MTTVGHLVSKPTKMMICRNFNLCPVLLLFVFAAVDASCQQVNTLNHNSTVTSSCPDRCVCRKVRSTFANVVDVTVDCTDRRHAHIPDSLPADTVALLLGQNRIQQLRPTDLQFCYRLQRLDLSKNKLLSQSLNKDVFNSLTNLVDLRLDHNYIHFSSLPADLFDHLPSLKVLHTHKNNWSLADDHNEQLYAKLCSLEDLTFDAIPYVPFSVGFSTLNHLTSLEIHGGLSNVSSETLLPFSNCPIKRLKLSARKFLCSLGSMSFSHFRQLEVLDLSYNHYLGLVGVSRAWPGLRFTNITTLRLSRVDNSSATHVNEAFFAHLERTNVQQLSLDKNNIVHVDPVLSKYLPNLVSLDVSFNRLGSVANMALDLRQLTRLKYLDASHQMKRWHNPDQDSSYNNNNPSVMDHSKNSSHGRTSTPPPIDIGFIDWPHCSTPIPTINLTRCLSMLNIIHSKFPFDVDGPWCTPVPPSLEVVNLTESTNVEVFQLPEVLFVGGNHIRLIDFRLNGFTKILGPIVFTENTHSLKVDFGDNDIVCLSPNAFEISSSAGRFLSELDLSGNRMSEQLVADVTGRTFRHLHQLRVLSLARNELASLPRAIFRHIGSVRELNLSQNFLKVINFDLSHMKHLSVLDISQNQFISLDETAMRNISVMMARNGTSFQIHMINNPFHCSCDTLDFLHWMQQKRRHFVDFAGYSCMLRGSVKTFDRLDHDILQELDFRCAEPLIVVVSGCLLGLVLVLLVVSVCCYRYRWELRYCCLRLTQRGKKVQVIVDQPTNYDYDAFIVYDSADRQWVNGELVPHLEGHKESDTSNIRLCVHERDFPPGEDIVGNIWNKMERSRKIVLVLSRTFTKSNYCNYELELARIHSLEKGRNLIVPVMLQSVDIRNMSDSLSWIVRKLTYIQWPRSASESELERDEFWEKLRQAVVADGPDLWNLSPTDATSPRSPRLCQAS